MSCWWRHKWTKWSDPYEFKFWYVADGKVLSERNFTELRQKRDCTRCNKQETRTIQEA